MITIEALSGHLAMQLKQARLAALTDTPTAFGSTYARESTRTDEDWVKLASAWNSTRSAFYLAIDDGVPLGMIGGKVDEMVARRGWVVSMWVTPTHRRTSLGTKLMDEVQQWAYRVGIDELRLMVTSNNAAAKAFYEKCGFRATGLTQPYENDPALFEFEMARSIASR